MKDNTSHRRTFLKRAGAVGLAGGVGTFAGCTSDGGDGGGGDGGSNGGDGGSGGDGASGGDGTSGGDGGSQGTTTGGNGELTTFKVGMPPLGPAMLAYGYINDQTDILKTEMENAGYELDVQVTWDEITLFAAGKVDMVPSLSDIEGTRIAVERDMPITFHGLYATNYEGLYVRKGSKWDPDNSGSVEATLEMLANGEGTWANAGWNQGSVVAGQLVMKDVFGYDYGPDKSDFNVQSADWFALPKLLADGKVDMITNAPPLGSDIMLAKEDDGENPIKDIYWYQPGLEEAGFAATTANLGNFGTTQQFGDEHRDAVRAWIKAWREGTRYASNPDNFEEILSKQENIDALGGNNKEEARIVLEFSQQPPKWCMSDPGNTAKVIAEDPLIDQEYVETDKKALARAEELGALPSGWQDYVEFDPVEL